MPFHDISLAAGKATLKVTMMLDFEDLNYKTMSGKKDILSLSNPCTSHPTWIWKSDI